MESKKEYWLICCKSKAPLMRDLEYTVVISEPLEKFLINNVKYAKVSYREFVATSITEIDERKFKALRPFNPTNEGYLKFKREDYSNFLVGD